MVLFFSSSLSSSLVCRWIIPFLHFFFGCPRKSETESNKETGHYFVELGIERESNEKEKNTENDTHVFFHKIHCLFFHWNIKMDITNRVRFSHFLFYLLWLYRFIFTVHMKYALNMEHILSLMSYVIIIIEHIDLKISKYI